MLRILNWNLFLPSAWGCGYDFVYIIDSCNCIGNVIILDVYLNQIEICCDPWCMVYSLKFKPSVYSMAPGSKAPT